MTLLVLAVVLPCIVIIGSILYINIYLRKQIKKNKDPKPVIDEAYIEAEKTRGNDEDFGSAFK
ncbi:MAG: trace amine-associated receptor [Fibromonadaceae bacterium]|jgi:hypothetical protein|nr:trace amine-associated receptor [Fibromonadaceae bacterium]